MKALVKQYRFLLVTLLLFAATWLLWPQIGFRAIRTIGFGLKEMLLVIPPVFVLLGLLDVWVPRETMIRHMGPGSGVRGGVLAFVLGSAAAGPLYAAFPITAVLLRKGASLPNVLVFVGAWSTTKVPMFLFEYTALGSTFAITRLLVDIPGIVVIAFILNRMLPAAEVERIYERASEVERPAAERKDQGNAEPRG